MSRTSARPIGSHADSRSWTCGGLGHAGIRVFYEEVGCVKLGDFFTLDVARRDLRGEFRTAQRLYFWNSWLAK